MNALEVQGLSKRYNIAHQTRADTLRDAITKGIGGIWRLLKNQRLRREDFWALKDISFTVPEGEVLGVIGRNGAGKSTLLKLLSRITEPTTGSIKLRGRVASLLEVGTGFHPELSGRENIFLNGAILGMSRTEIVKRFDEIVAFAEVENFLDTPVKRYSSGMYVRLAFAVAAHLEPEILIVDEVLAVGDSKFQTKCIEKMDSVKNSGRSVLFVSHNIASIRRLCTSGLLLESGKLGASGSISEITDLYVRSTAKNMRTTPIRERLDRQGTGLAKIVGFAVMDTNREIVDKLVSGQSYIFSIDVELPQTRHEIDDIIASLSLVDDRNETILLVRSNFEQNEISISRAKSRINCCINTLAVAEGNYTCTLFLSHRDSEILDLLESAAEVRVETGDYFGTGNPGMPSQCKTLTRSDWTTE